VAYALCIHDLDLAGHDVATRRVSLEVRQGEAVGILGRAGMGKSLLLRVLSGQRPGHGESLEVLGLDLRREPRRVWESVGFVTGSTDTLLPWRSAVGNLHLEAQQKGMPAGRIDAAARLQLERHRFLQRAAPRVAQRDPDAPFACGSQRGISATIDLPRRARRGAARHRDVPLGDRTVVDRRREPHAGRGRESLCVPGPADPAGVWTSAAWYPTRCGRAGGHRVTVAESGKAQRRTPRRHRLRHADTLQHLTR
jgi:hypothetical protein